MTVEARDSAPPAKPPIWNDPRYRALFFQALVLGGVLLAGWALVNNTLNNMESRGIASGFGFLNKTSGFSINMHLIDYAEENTYGRVFVVGLINTILVSVVGVFFATILGFIIGIARLSSNWLVSRLAAVYIEVLRNIPLLLQIFFWYFALLRSDLIPSVRNSLGLFDVFFLNIRGLFLPRPIFEAGFSAVFITFLITLVGVIILVRWARRRQERSGKQFHSVYASLGLLIGLPLIVAALAGFPLSWDLPVLKGFNFVGGVQLVPEFVALVFALSLYTAAFIAEVVRSGIMAVSKGQTEAALSVGLTTGQTLRLIVLPQALRVIIPPLTNQYLNLTKNSSLAAAIAYPDLVLVFAGTALMQTGQAVEIIAITMAVYLTLSLVISLTMGFFNRRFAIVDR